MFSSNRVYYNRLLNTYIKGVMDISGALNLRLNTDVNFEISSYDISGLDMSGNIITIKTPIYYSLREKFIDISNNFYKYADLYSNQSINGIKTFNSDLLGNQIYSNTLYENSISLIDKYALKTDLLTISNTIINVNNTINNLQYQTITISSSITNIYNLIQNQTTTISSLATNYDIFKKYATISDLMTLSDNIANALVDYKDYSRKLNWRYKDPSGNFFNRASIYSNALKDEFNIDLTGNLTDTFNINYDNNKGLVLSNNYSTSNMITNGINPNYLTIETYYRQCYEITTTPFFHKDIYLKIPIAVWYTRTYTAGTYNSTITFEDCDVSIFKNGVYHSTINYNINPNITKNFTTVAVGASTNASAKQFMFTLSINFRPDYEDATNYYSFHAFIYSTGSGVFVGSPAGYNVQVNTPVQTTSLLNVTALSSNETGYEKSEKLVSYKIYDISNSTLEINDIICNNLICNSFTTINSSSNVAYDSGWFAVSTNQAYEKYHNLNMDITNPFQVILYFSATSTPTGNGDIYDANKQIYTGGNYGVFIDQMNKNSVVIKSGNLSVYYEPATATSGYTGQLNPTSGFYRLYLISPSKVMKGERGLTGYTDISGAIISNATAYDSGWFSVATNTTYTITHNLKMNISRPVRYTVLFSNVANPVLGTDLIFEVAQNSFAESGFYGCFSSNFLINDFQLRSGSVGVAYRVNATNTNYTTGYYRVYVYDSAIIAKGNDGAIGPMGTISGAITTNSAQYDSGWFSVSANTTYEKNHNLNMSLTKPLQYRLYFSDNSNPSIGTHNIIDITGQNINSSYDNGYSINYTYTNFLSIRTGDINVALYYNRTTNTYTSATTGYYRLLLYDNNVFIKGEQGIAGPTSNNSYFYLNGTNLYTGTSTTPMYSITATSYSAVSDRKIKDNIEELTTQNIDNIKGYKYFNKLSKKNDIGLIAQEIELEFPELVEKSFVDDDEIMSVNYMAFIPILIHEIKQLKKRIKKLENKI